ncbi:MAG: DUF2442 domain-containing protein [Candidatus Caenarcaniphilales bacterium]|nr:DUF2442 domain-containing protein [Candidatus Caenarcaniphilales bacterium]
MNKYPKLKSVQAIDSTTLLAEFDNHEFRRYSMARLLQNPIFEPLKNPALFKAVQIEVGGYAVSWNNEIDLSEYEIWTNGEKV